MFNSVPAIRPTADRRKDARGPLLPCSRCVDAPVSVILRAEATVYVECLRCLRIRAMPKAPRCCAAGLPNRAR